LVAQDEVDAQQVEVVGVVYLYFVQKKPCQTDRATI
jgi:hypothetical protein